MPGKKTRRIQTRSRRGRRLVRKTRRQAKRQSLRKTWRQTKRKQRGGNIFLDANRTPADAVIAGGINPDIEGGTGIMRVKAEADAELAEEETGPSQGV